MNGDNLTKAGVIGVGSMGRHHARVYSELPNVDLVGVFDVDDEAAAGIAERYGTRAFDMDDLLDAVDVASIAVPTAYHFDVARECIERGVDVLVEKPFVGDPDEGRELIDLAEARGVMIQVGHIERFNPAVMALDDIVRDLDVIAIEAKRLGPPPQRTIEDSAVMDLMIHDVDLLLAITDAEIDAIDAMGARENRYAVANVQFENDVVGTLTASRLTQEKVRQLTITADDCLVKVDYIDRSIEIHRHMSHEYVEAHGDRRYRRESTIERPMVDNGEPLKNELSAFVAAATGDREPVVTAEDGLRVVEVIQEIDERAFTRRRRVQEAETGSEVTR